eukprot:CAMPEP_0195128358 /NCGR_PEP_ID=MMETSP0448-20130528/139039_1 /TAXON_ID=66468 /ORGANISM="Heterocapsa triquestra, Strain CCMP 448" /LENGTH=65 /DNA_ID=CAMNT_0040166157 /DNA_START=163 /DNA_END=357 /DNA_ORIENTATION=-
MYSADLRCGMSTAVFGVCTAGCCALAGSTRAVGDASSLGVPTTDAQELTSVSVLAKVVSISNHSS